MFQHQWVLFNLPGNIPELSENVPKLEVLKNEVRQGKNDFGKIGWEDHAIRV
jgi:hypothetical protein